MRWPWSRKSSPRSAPHLELGERGEDWAARYLRRQGYKILVRHFRSQAGEIDIVARHRDWLVFVEVKTRETEDYGAPSEAVNKTKQRHMSKVALDYLRLLNYPQIRFRFDIVEVLWHPGHPEPADIRLIQNAFDLTEPYLY